MYILPLSVSGTLPGPNSHETPGTSLPVLSPTPKSLPPAPIGTTPGSSNKGFSVEDMASAWAETMEIPWDQCSPALNNACLDNQIPDKKELLAFNRVLSEAIHLVEPRPGKRALASSAFSKIVMDQCAGSQIICQMEKQKRAKKKDASGLLRNTQERTRMRGKFTIG